MSDAEYIALVEELESIAVKYRGETNNPDGDTFLFNTSDLWNEPWLAVSSLLCADAVGDRILPDEVVTRLWEMAWVLANEPADVVPRDVLLVAREGRRTWPPEPVEFPLKGGGHGSGRGLSGKTEYPSRWSDDDAIDYVMDVAQEPDGAVKQPDGLFRAHGVRDGVELRVIVTELGQVVTAYPVAGEGVVTNPLDDVRAPYVERLQRLVDSTDLDDETRAGIDELMRVGEWDQVVQQLRVLPTPDADELQQLAQAAGITTPEKPTTC